MNPFTSDASRRVSHFMDYYDSDAVDSDDLEPILQRSLAEQSGTSAARETAPRTNVADIRKRIKGLDGEIDNRLERINELNATIHKLQAEVATFRREKAHLKQSLLQPKAGESSREEPASINYLEGGFDWDPLLESTMKRVFKIDSFRLCQRGVCNANMDRRDIVCIMPTGGGKSLTYQLPALLNSGCTIVICPLLSLMSDQLSHLREMGIVAASLTSNTSQAQKTATTRQLEELTREGRPPSPDDIKLLYVTPEKLHKDKRFKALLQRLDEAKKLARFVIDEAHCVSQLGHDFRPDYGKLRELRLLCPEVPVLALSATCGPKVLADLIQNLKLKATVDGTCAPRLGTIYFEAPLYRKNLLYRVVSKPDKQEDHLRMIMDYILEKHPTGSGIIYCFKTKEAETVAAQLMKMSSGRIKTACYHAKIEPPSRREEVLEAWRRGDIQVVCATIAFGMGIDKGEVRFVLHHTIPKSVEGFYQESGRAGRDGKDADCILYYKPSDFSSIASLVSEDNQGPEKVFDMIKFAENLSLCRKIHFANYFSHSSQVSKSAWSTEDVDVNKGCGHCDNCERDPTSLEERDLTVESWRILTILKHITETTKRVTLIQLAEQASRKKAGPKPNGNGKSKLDVAKVAGDLVGLSKREIEHLLIHLLQKKYVKITYHTPGHQNSSTNVYFAIGPFANNLLNLSLEEVTSGEEPRIRLQWPKPAPKSSKRKAPTSKKDPQEASAAPLSKKQKTLTSHFTATVSASGSKKQPDDWDDMYESDGNLDPIEVIDDDDSMASEIERLEDVQETSSDQEPGRQGRSRKGKEKMTGQADIGSLDGDAEMDSEDVDQIWSRSWRDDTIKYSKPSTSKTRSKARGESSSKPLSKPVSKPKPRAKVISTEIIELSD